LETEVEKILPHLECKKEEWLTEDNKFLQKPLNYLEQAVRDGWERILTVRKNDRKQKPAEAGLIGAVVLLL
jgi:hypothetical protein